MKHYPHHSYAVTGMGRLLVQKIPAHVRYASVLPVLLGGALLASVTALGYTATLLGQFMKTSADLAETVGKLEKAPPSAPLASFCPFPFNPANPGCQTQAATKKVAAPPSVTPKADTPVANPLGWVYAGKNNLQKVIQTEGNLLTGKVYTMLQNLNVRRLPESSKVNENHQVLRTVFVGEKVRVLAQANNGEHLWLQIAHP